MDTNPPPLPPVLLLFMLCLSTITLTTSHITTTTTTTTAVIDEATPLLYFKTLIQKDINGVLSNWKPNTNPCKWYGITCSTQNKVTHLDLSQCNLFATLSAAFRSFSYLQSLTVLNLSGNSFTINSTSLLHLPPQLSQLLMSFSGLVGTVPDSLFTNCPNLVSVDLSFNNLTGPLPENMLSNSNKLQSLDLSYNNISGSFTSVKFFPTSCNSLLHLDLSENRLAGSIPESISSCTNLQTITLTSNQLSGDIPASIGELKVLQKLDISNNYINGWIPWQLGNTCNALIELKLSHNNISGPIPASLSTCKWLQILDVSNNNVSGPLPDSLLKNLTSLERLILSNNVISGAFPSSISSCNKLKIVDLSSNRFTGVIPEDICPGAASLEELRLPDNRVTGHIPATLSQCSNLKTLDFSLNYLTGSIPPEIGKLEKLEQLIAWYNGIEGKIPSELGSCLSLKNLILNNNFLTGEIPQEIFNCGDLEWISLTSNRLTGEIPREFGILERLAVLQLGNNSLSGKLPSELGNCSSLVWLDLSSNKLTGEIPPHIGRQPGSKALSGILSGNTLVFVRNVGNSCRGVGGLLEFAGIRPERLQQVPSLKSCDFTRLYSGPVLSLFTQYQTLEYLDLSYNQLHGKIPDEFGNMEALQVLELSNNQLSGEIPDTFGGLKNLGVFDASHNRLQGRIPDSFSKLSFLVQIDLSYNELTGEIPQRGQLSTLPAEQYAHNPGLCGPPLEECGSGNVNGNGMNSNSSDVSGRRKPQGASLAHSVMWGVLVSVVFVCVLIIWGLAMRARRREAEQVKMLGSLKANHAATTWKIDKEKEPLSINVATFQRQLRKLKFSQLIEATNGFSAASLIGSGGFGEVFRATLKDGSSVAIKKLVQLSCQGDREFMAEMETLGKIKHKNLVPLLGYCKIGEERLLVYEYMEYGSLEEVLHGRAKTRILTWDERKKIARGAAKGLCFLHHNCIPHIIHRDMKSSNVLLDHDMEAKVSDFGMARLISALDTHLSVSTLAGTPGYVPPEYYQSFRCTAKGDVYSVGVVLLELITGKRPTDKEEFGDTNLVGWAKMKVREGKVMEVIDDELLAGTDKEKNDEVASDDQVKEMIRYLEITMQCVDDFPSRRQNMLQVVTMLRDLSVAPGSSSNSG